MGFASSCAAVLFITTAGFKIHSYPPRQPCCALLSKASFWTGPGGYSSISCSQSVVSQSMLLFGLLSSCSPSPLVVCWLCVNAAPAPCFHLHGQIDTYRGVCDENRALLSHLLDDNKSVSPGDATTYPTLEAHLDQCGGVLLLLLLDQAPARPQPTRAKRRRPQLLAYLRPWSQTRPRPRTVTMDPRAGFDRLVASVTFSGSLISFVATTAVLCAYVYYRDEQRSFRHALVFNLALAGRALYLSLSLCAHTNRLR